MNETFINYNLVEIALEKLSGSLFEGFANAYFSSIFGIEFIPLGGVKDGGADAFQEQVWEDSEKNTIFYQASIQKDFKTKIKKTHKRLIEFGRIPKRIVYLTSQIVEKIDVVEEELTDELNCRIVIRDKRYIVSHISENHGTRAAYETFLKPALGYLAEVGGSKLISPSSIENSSTIYVFLRQELERQRGKTSLVNALADGLILWALEGTDPDMNILMSEREIISKIKDTIPSALKVIKGAIPKRLESLSKISQSQGRPIRKYTKQQAYCLSYDFRKRLIEDNAVDETLRIKVRESFSKRLSEFQENSLTIDEVEMACDLAMQIIQKTFENQGLEFAKFLNQNDSKIHNLTISDYFDELVSNFDFVSKRELLVKEAVLENLRGAFYNSEECERLFFSKLCSTYTLLFCLKSEPKIVEYFQKMATSFYLYLGSDLIVRALSERYLRPEDQITRNALNLIKKVGGTLVLPESVLDEVYIHVRNSYYEFLNFYQNIESSITLDIAKQSDKILIRAYFYSKLNPCDEIKSPNNWTQFIDQFCDYTQIGSPRGREQIKKYLMSEFNLKYEDNEELSKFANNTQVKNLADKLNYKKQAKLALNDALLVLAVYGRRRLRNETNHVSEYGYRTWWLTQESTIVKYTRELENKNGAKYIMRPEFLVNFFSLAPSVAEVRKTYANIFPTVLGIRLARRVKQEKLMEVLGLVNEAQELESGRRKAKVAEYSDELKTITLESSISKTEEEDNF